MTTVINKSCNIFRYTVDRPSGNSLHSITTSLPHEKARAKCIMPNENGSATRVHEDNNVLSRDRFRALLVFSLVHWLIISAIPPKVFAPYYTKSHMDRKVPADYKQQTTTTEKERERERERERARENTR